MSHLDTVRTRSQMLDVDFKGSGFGEVINNQDIRNMVTTMFGPHVAKTNVDASAGGVAQTTAIFTVPANSIITDVVAVVITPFDGATTQTFEVGITANPDNYIDTIDFNPASAAGTIASSNGGTTNDQTVNEHATAAVAVEALWTNTASATAGSVDVYVFYTTVV